MADAHSLDHTELDHTEIVASEGAALIAAVRTGPLDASVAACPGWDLVDLSRHIGTTWRWAAATVNERRTSPGAYDPPPDLAAAAAVDYLDTGLVTVIDALRSCPRETPVWGFGPHPRVAAFWSRRMAMETAVHRVDAERAIGEPAPVEAHIAGDGVGEFLDVMLPRQYYRKDPPPGQLRATVTDTGQTFAHGDPAAGTGTITGRAEDLFLALWQRRGWDGIDRGGDAHILDGWLALGAP